VGQISLERAQKFPSGGKIKSLGICILQSAEASIYNIGLFTLVNQVRNILIIEDSTYSLNIPSVPENVPKMVKCKLEIQRILNL
jgi:hypothetical protein